MTKDSKIAVFGDPQISAQLKATLLVSGYPCLDEGDLEIRDEFQVRGWMLENSPTHVFVCVGLFGQSSSQNLLFTLVGSIHVLNGAVGIAERVRLVSVMPTVEYSILRRLCELYFFEKELDYADILYSGRGKPEDYYRDCVLSMRDISAKEAHQSCYKGQKQRREVRDQVVQERQSDQAQLLPQCAGSGDPLRQPSQSLLEVPGSDVKGEAPRNLRAQCHTAAGQEARHTVYAHVGSIS